MGRRVLMAAAVMFVVGTAANAQAQVIHMSATLTGGNEVPPVLTGAYATAVVEVDMGTRTVTWSIDVFNLPSGINNAHFHVGPVGISGPTVVNVPFPSNASNEFNLSGSATAANLNVRGDQGIRSWDDFLQSLVGGQVYLNIHTNVNGGGEIRGQVLRDPSR